MFTYLIGIERIHFWLVQYIGRMKILVWRMKNAWIES